VTGVNADDGWAIAQKRLDLGREFLRQVLELRAETRLCALSGPHQLLAELRQHGALAAMGFDQRYPEKLGPLLEQVPDMPIGELGVGRSTGDFSGFPDFVEDAEHHHELPSFRNRQMVSISICSIVSPIYETYFI
jgi:hypothetical protein